MHSKTPSIQRSPAEASEHPLVQLVPPVERDLIEGDCVLAQPRRDGLDDFRCDVLVRASIDEGHPRGAQSIGDGVEREIEIGRKLATPQRETIDLRLPKGRPAADSGSALGIPQGVHRHTCAIEGPEHRRVHGIEVPHVVLDLGEPILSRHPACANASLRRTLAQIEPGQPLRRDEITMPIVEHAQLLQLAARFLEKLRVLDDGHRYLVAPEGLSRFYLSESPTERRVGASWMTREDRLAEIEDYVRYLDAVYADVFGFLDRALVTAHALGFSQGA